LFIIFFGWEGNVPILILVGVVVHLVEKPVGPINAKADGEKAKAAADELKNLHPEKTKDEGQKHDDD
jgi:hypothetical protein